MSLNSETATAQFLRTFLQNFYWLIINSLIFYK